MTRQVRSVLVAAVLATACDPPPAPEDPSNPAEPAPTSAGDPDLGGEPLPSFLSRENPIYALKEVSAPGTEDLFKTGQALSQETSTGEHGGTGGGYFDWHLPDPTWRLGWVYIKSGIYVDSIEVWWIDPSGNYHYSGRAGGSGGYGVNVPIGPGQIIPRATGRSGDLLDGLRLYDNTQSVIYQSNSFTGGQFWDEDIGQYNKQIHGFHGKCGKYVDRLGFYGYSP